MLSKGLGPFHSDALLTEMSITAPPSFSSSSPVIVRVAPLAGSCSRVKTSDDCDMLLAAP